MYFCQGKSKNISEKIMANTNILLNHIVDAIKEVKGFDIISLDLQKIEVSICKYFVICTGNSNTHVNAIEGKIKKNVSKKIGEKPLHIEGNNIGEWVLIDYSDIIVHIFQERIRNFYNLEDFWGDAKCMNYKTV